MESIIKRTDPNSSFLIKEPSFTFLVYKLNEYNENSSVNIDFTECEKKLRENLPSDTILRIVQINIPSQDEKVLNEQVEYKVYDQNNNEMDLSVCNDIPLIVENKLVDSSKLNMDKILELKNSGVDLFNIKDDFFNDICMPYSDNESNSDMILSDRVSDLFQNFSVCGEGCEYISFNETKMSVNCKCEIKQKISEEPEKGNFAEAIEGVFLYSNFGLVKCYKLSFSPKGKSENIGFIIYTIIILGHIPGYIFYFVGKINPIRNYLKNEMEKTGYITKDKINIKIVKNSNNPTKKKKRIELEDNEDKNRIKRFKIIKFRSQKYINNWFNTRIDTETIELTKRNNKKNFTQVYKKKAHLKNSKEKNSKQNIEEHFILINANNNINDYIPPSSNYNLDNYDYEEAIIYEKRTYPRILFIFLMNTEKILNTFVYKQPLELKPLRISMFLLNISSDIALNAIFYLSDNISEKYHYKGSSQFLFSLTNNLTLSIVSSMVGFILIFFFQNFVQSTNKIKKLFQDEED